MKKEHAFILATSLFGIIAGAWVAVVLMSIAAPSMSQYLLTLAEKADRDRMGEVARSIAGTGFRSVFLAVLAASLLTVFSFFLLVINPQAKHALKQWRSRAGAKLLVVFLALLGLFYLQIVGIDSMLSLGEKANTFARLLVMAVWIGAVWVVAGEQGWAGDFSSWGAPKDARRGRAMLLGAAAGTAIFVVYLIYDRAFGKYFTLVSEVLDRSGETSSLGFIQLAVGLVIGFGVLFPITAGFVTALAPVRRDNREVRRRLIVPVGALIAVCILLGVAYGYAGTKYDLDKADLAAVLGVPDKARESRTIVVFLPSKNLPVTILEWPLQVSGSGLSSQSTIELTRENLQKVESYLTAHPEGTIFTYAARDILMNGYYALWDVKKGMAWQVKAAEFQLIPRLQLLARFRSLQITEENLKLL